MKLWNRFTRRRVPEPPHPAADKSGEDALRCRLSAAALDHIPDEIYIKDTTGRYILVNAAAAARFGASPESVVGKDDFALFTPRRAQKCAEDDNQVLASGSSQTEGIVLRTSKGERAHLITRVPFRDASGTVLGLVAISRDVTGLKQAENEHFRQVVETANDAFVSSDTAGTIVEWNGRAEVLLGWTRREALGLPVVETLIPARYREAHRLGLTHYLPSTAEPRAAGRIAIEVLHRSGHEIPVEMTIWATPVNGAQQLNVFLRDNREQLRQEFLTRKNRELTEENRRVAEGSRLKSSFVANMSHELRTPLNAVIGFTELLSDGRLGPVTDEQRESLQDILTSSRHLLTLINSVLDLAKVESGKIEFRPESVHLNHLAGEVCEVLHPLAAEKNIRLHCDVSPDLGVVLIDPTRLKQVLFNFLSNAIKFTDDSGQVFVRIRPEGSGSFRLEVQDSGIGIDAADQGRLFVEFQQLDGGTGKQYQGTGLGLALTKRIVDAQGGQVGVKSSPNRGSTFFAILPLRPIQQGNETVGIRKAFVAT